MILTAVALLEKTSAPSREQIIEGMNGNLCRCCGYTRIIAAVERVVGVPNEPEVVMRDMLETDAGVEPERYELREDPRYRFALGRRAFFGVAGAGETPMIAVPPAIGNAVFHACGVRVRSRRCGEPRRPASNPFHFLYRFLQ